MDIESRIDEALEYIQNDTDYSLELFDDILDEDPNNIKAINGKGSAMMKLHQNEEALKLFDHSLSIEENASAYLNKGIIAKSNKDYKNALKYFDNALKFNPRLSSIVSILKNEILETANLESANIDSLYDFKEDTSFLIKEAIGLKNQNKIWDSLDCLQKAIEEDPTCKNSVNDLMVKIKKELLKEFLYREPKSTPKVTSLKSTKRENSKSPSKQASIENKRINKLKNLTYRSIINENNPHKALALTDRIFEINENDLDGLNFKGISYFYLDEYEKSIETFDKILSIDCDFSYAIFNKGLVLRRMQLYEESLKCFEKALNDINFYNKIKPYQEEVLIKLK